MKTNLNQYLTVTKYILIFSSIIIILAVIYGVKQTRNLSEKFKKTELNISREQLIDIWGKPDEEFNMNLSYDKRHVIKYNDLFGYTYIFTSKSGKKNISEKFIDD